MAKEKQTFYVSGMHCKSCEILIQNKIGELGGVKSVKASTSQGRVDVESSVGVLNISKLNSMFGEHGYSFFETEPKSKIASLIEALLIILAVAGVNYLFGFPRFLPSINTIGSGSVGGMFLFGLAAGVSSCAALSGALILALVKKWKEKGVMGSAVFVSGRMLSYALAGVILGFVGTLFKVSPTVLVVFSLIISLFMIVLALQMLGYGIFAIFQPNSPKFLDKEPDKKTMPGAFLLGMSTLLLPCGFTLTAAGLAGTLAKPIPSGLIMLSFAIGSSVILFLIGVTGHKFLNNPKVGSYVGKVAGFVILFLAINTISNQVDSSNLFVRAEKGKPAVTTANGQTGTVPNGSVQVIKMNASAQGYSPSSFKIKVNQPVRWEITDIGTSGCTNAVIAPGLFDGQIPLTRGQTSAKEFTPTKTGTFRFSCWMGMIRGTMEVTN